MLEKKHIIILKIWGTKRTWKCKLQLVYCDRPRDVVGYRFDKGPVYVRNTWFHGFQPTSIYNSSALSNTECFSLMNPQNMVENVLFGFDDVIQVNYIAFCCNSLNISCYKIYPLSYFLILTKVTAPKLFAFYHKIWSPTFIRHYYYYQLIAVNKCRSLEAEFCSETASPRKVKMVCSQSKTLKMVWPEVHL